MRFRVEIPEGGVVPHGYGIAWHAIDRAVCVLMPLPLNVLAAWLRAAYRWLRFPPGRFVGARQLAAAESRGYQRGRDASASDSDSEYRRGVADGRNAAWRDITNALADQETP